MIPWKLFICSDFLAESLVIRKFTTNVPKILDLKSSSETSMNFNLN